MYHPTRLSYTMVKMICFTFHTQNKPARDPNQTTLNVRQSIININDWKAGMHIWKHSWKQMPEAGPFTVRNTHCLCSLSAVLLWFWSVRNFLDLEACLPPSSSRLSLDLGPLQHPSQSGCFYERIRITPFPPFNFCISFDLEVLTFL